MARTWNLKADPIQCKVRSARIRHLVGLVLEQSAIGMAIVLLVLELGHRNLWTVIVIVLVAAAGGFQVKRRLRTPYEIAQILDTRAGLRDSFSTAWFLLEHPGQAAGPNAAAYIAHTKSVLPEIRPSDSFPVPLRSLLAIAGLSILFVATNFVFPGPARQGKSLTVATRAGSRPDAGVPSYPVKGEEVRGITEGRLATGVPSFNRGHQQEGRIDSATVETQSPKMHAGDSQMPVKAETSSPNATTIYPFEARQERTENGQTSPPGTQSKAHQSGSQESMPSRLLSQLRRLLGNERQPSAAAKAEPQIAASRPAKATAEVNRPAGTAPASTPGKMEYGAAGTSAQQTSDKNPANSPASIGASPAEAALRGPDSFPTAVNVIELADASPDGETGHTKVQAMRSVASHQGMDSPALEHHADSGHGVMRDDVPLGYQRSIQAYFERTRTGNVPAK